MGGDVVSDAKDFPDIAGTAENFAWTSTNAFTSSGSEIFIVAIVQSSLT
jgi:hypothetical protein